MKFDDTKYEINAEKLVIEGESEGTNSFNSIFEKEINDWKINFETRAENITVKGSSPPCLQIRQLVKQNNNRILSIITEKYVYLSGLHGNSWWSAKNFDTELDRQLLLDDIFSDQNYEKVLNEKMSEIIKEKPDEYHDLWEIPVINPGHKNNFYLTEKNLVIFFQPYELSYYARGVVEFEIPLEKIRGYIKKEYLPN